ncbi:undecaprenyldiphospho-muramoylpentapeptide beta-N-acetylglucosaminyltransferase [Verrucomicrobiota bacterium]
MSKKLKVAVSCGGTGGHIFPGLAVAAALKARGHDVTIWMAGKDVESEALREWQGHVVTVPSEGLQYGVSLRALLAAFRMLKAGFKCLPLMKKHRPEVVLGMGSYASFGPLFASKLLRIPYVLHEANVIPGKANKLFAHGAAKIAVAFEETRHYLQNHRVAGVGMPLRADLRQAANAAESADFSDTLNVLIMGGSRGARALNEMIPQALAKVLAKGYKVRAIHLAGVAEEEKVRALYEELDVPNETIGFAHDMASLYKRANLAICRSGASSCFELAAFGLPSLLIPFPYAANDHQFANAESLEKAGAAHVIRQKDVEQDWLAEYLINFFKQPERLKAMAVSAKKIGERNSAEALADVIEQTVA